MDLPDRGRRLVCRRCHVVMDDFEPADKNGEFWHPKLLKDQKTPRKCPNAGRAFYLDEIPESKEVELFKRKRERRRGA